MVIYAVPFANAKRKLGEIGSNVNLRFVRLTCFLSPQIEPCDHSFMSSDVFSSPNYPASYGSNEKCEFLAEAPSGKIIGLAFNSFAVEDSPDCVDDSVKVCAQQTVQFTFQKSHLSTF